MDKKSHVKTHKKKPREIFFEELSGHEIYMIEEDNKFFYYYKNMYHHVEFTKSKKEDSEYIDEHLFGYPIVFTKICQNLYSMTYGILGKSSQRSDNSLTSIFFSKSKSNYHFLEKSLTHLFSINPNLEIFERIALSESISGNIFNSQNENKDNLNLNDNRRIIFFKKNKFLIIDNKYKISNIESNYFKNIKRIYKNYEHCKYIYINKEIFEC